jgi:uncharacterized membrane protein
MLKQVQHDTLNYVYKIMIKKLKDTGRLNITILLFLFSMFSFYLFLFRVLYTGTSEFLFLNWNLFLAFIPWFISSIIILKKLQSNKILLSLLMITWVLFFPNSPYILTDLFHLGMSIKAPIWYDLILILSFAGTGLLFGFMSLLDIEKILSTFFSKGKIVFIIISFLFLSGFGIYIGRYLRWNSWDVVNNPVLMSYDILYKLAHPIAHPKMWGLTILLGILLNLFYFSFKFIKVEKE